MNASSNDCLRRSNSWRAAPFTDALGELPHLWQPRCRCHAQGPKHGPHLYISYRGESGKTTGYYVPKAAESDVRRAVEAWSQLQTQLRQLSVLNKERALEAARVKK